MSRKLSLGFSSCPNDTFIFDAMVNSKIDTEGLEFEPFIADVEVLNKRAFNQDLDITKVSFNAFISLADNYELLNSGAALGENCGPLIIAKEKFDLNELASKKIAIPGENTTANLLMKIAFPNSKNKVEMLFSDIEKAVLNNEVDAGLIIHESRFTYKQKGLIKIIDLGEFWEEKTKTPTPLGGIIVNKRLDLETREKVNRVMKRSVQFAFDNPKETEAFVSKYAQEMDKEIMYKHIDLYVNNYTLDLGEQGVEAIRMLFMLSKGL